MEMCIKKDRAIADPAFSLLQCKVEHARGHILAPF